MKNFLFALMAFGLLFTLFSCNDNLYLGITPGGSQDNAYARRLIKEGIVPGPELFTYEGMFSEHDFHLNIDNECNDAVCIDTVITKYKPILGDNKEKYVAQLIMSSNIEAENFKHAPIDLFIVLDKSGSMSGTRMKEAKEAVKSVVDKLNADDTFGLIVFNSEYKVKRELSEVGEDKSKIKAIIDDLNANGGTNIEDALKKAYELLERYGKKSNRRIILITDARPNIGAVGENDFLGIIREYEQKIGITVFGVGLDFGQGLAKAISETKGGNYIYLSDIKQIKKRLDEEFEFLISPIAENFKLNIKSFEHFKILNTYGLPQKNNENIQLSAKTLFLSKTKGAVAIEFEYENPDDNIIVPMDNENFFGYDWEYSDLNGVKSEKSEMIYFSPFSNTSGNYGYSIEGSEKLPFLINMVSVLKEVCSMYYTYTENSAEFKQKEIDLLDKLLYDLDAVNSVLEDEQLLIEKDMISDLKDIIKKGY